MKNVTITVDDSVLEWARIEAARRGSSVSRMLGDFMAEMMQREDAYERAYLAWRTDERSWLAGTPPLGGAKSTARRAEDDPILGAKSRDRTLARGLKGSKTALQRPGAPASAEEVAAAPAAPAGVAR